MQQPNQPQIPQQPNNPINKKYLIAKDCSNLVQFSSILNKYVSLVTKKMVTHYTLDKVNDLFKILNEKKIKSFEITTSMSDKDQHYSVYCFIKWVATNERLHQEHFDINMDNNEIRFYINQACLNIYVDQNVADQILIKNLKEDKGFDKYIKKKLQLQTKSHNELFNEIYGYFETKVIIENDFFNIWLDRLDSKAIIIGKNGIGKTRFLKVIESLDTFNPKCEPSNILYINDGLVYNFGSNKRGGIGSNNYFNNFKSCYKQILKNLNSLLNKYQQTFELHSINNETINFKSKDPTIVELMTYKELSTGEKTFFVLITWISYIINDCNGDVVKMKSPKLLLLDEIETTLHSDSLCNMFEILCENTSIYNIHILLSTHSATTLRISAGYQFKYYLLKREEGGRGDEKVTIKDIKSYESAINNVSGGKLSVVDDTKLVLVEDEDDRLFYSMVYKKIFQPESNPSKTRLVFCEAGAKRFEQPILDGMINDLVEIAKEHSNSKPKIDKIISTLKSSNNIGGCTEVKKKVKLLSQKLVNSFRLGNSQVIGLIDSDDGERESTMNNIVTISYYSFEMYICFPLVLYYLDCNKHLQHPSITDPNKIIELVVDDLIQRESTIQIKHGTETRGKIDYFYQNSIRSNKKIKLSNSPTNNNNTTSSSVSVSPLNNHPLKLNMQTVQLLKDCDINNYEVDNEDSMTSDDNESCKQSFVSVPLVFTEGIGEGGERGHFLLQSLALIYYYDKSKSYNVIFKEFSHKLFRAYESLPCTYIPSNLKKALINVMSSTG